MQRFTPRLTRELATFLILTFGLSSIFYVLCARAGTLTAGGGFYVFMLMWCPGVSALATRLIFQHNVRGEGWKWGPTRYEVITDITKYLLSEFGAVLALAAIVTGYIFWTLRYRLVDSSVT
jgi:hypothetical protein